MDKIFNKKMPKHDNVVNDRTYIISLIHKGTLIVSCLLVIMLVIALLITHNTNLLPRFAIGSLVIVYLSTISILLKMNHSLVGAWMIISLYGLLAIIIMANWGINAPVGILIFGFIIFLANVLLGSKYIVKVTFAIILSIVALYLLDYAGFYKPNLDVLSFDSTLGDVATYVTIFGIFALIAWLSGRRSELSLNRALNAETELQKEKDSLALRLAEQSLILKQSQQEEMLQLYRFAELGQLTTAILHDLANNLSVLSLDIDDLQQESKTSKTIKRTKDSITYLEKMVKKVRSHINQGDDIKRFNLVNVINDLVSELAIKTKQAGIKIIQTNKSPTIYYSGDPLRLTQVISILLNNALDAIPADNERKEVIISTIQHGNKVKISIADSGVGIPQHVRHSLFEPLKSTKDNGLGMGLFVAKQIVETHFKGSLSLNSDTKNTVFVISIPLSKHSN